MRRRSLPAEMRIDAHHERSKRFEKQTYRVVRRLRQRIAREPPCDLNRRLFDRNGCLDHEKAARAGRTAQARQVAGGLRAWLRAGRVAIWRGQ